MFYVYCRSYYPVYEPAEGGYYVCCSEITECHEFTTLENAYAELLTMIAMAEEEWHTVSRANWDCGLKTYDEGDWAETYLTFPYVVYDETGYVGSGFELGISAEKPEDDPYQGYC